MDPEIVEQIRDANEAAIALVTTLVVGDDVGAITMLVTDPAYSDKATCLAVATLTTSAIKTMAQLLDCDPIEIVQVAGLSAAEFHIGLEDL